MQRKVYCKDCKYDKTYSNYIDMWDCNHPDNIKENEFGHWKYKERPWIINKHNDCEWYVQYAIKSTN